MNSRLNYTVDNVTVIKMIFLANFMTDTFDHQELISN